MKKSEVIYIRITPAEKRRIDDAARKAGTTTAEFARRVLGIYTEKYPVAR